jgi:hypothetical protein
MYAWPHTWQPHYTSWQHTKGGENVSKNLEQFTRCCIERIIGEGSFVLLLDIGHTLAIITTTCTSVHNNNGKNNNAKIENMNLKPQL